MKLRLSRQRETNYEQLDLKALCSYDDPAFSPDPHSNPYSVTSHTSWLSPPPLGHPVLKNKKQPKIALSPHDTPGSDSDFHPVQPPNSPVIPSGSNSSPQYHLTAHNKLPIPSSMNQGLTSVVSQGDRRSSLLPPLKTEKKRMNFLFRRQSAQSRPVKSFFSSIGKKERHHSEIPTDATLPPRSVQHIEGLPSSTSVTSVTSQIPEHRGLDQVDELDETNPWGIPIHHDGPYEGVNVPINKCVGNRVPLGLANDNELYKRRAFKSNGQIYVPPQVPTGVSLNLSPGQILPRQSLVPFIQPATIPSMPPPLGPSIPHISAGPLLTPPYEPHYMATFPDVDSGSQVHGVRSPIQEAMQHSDDLSFNIGMAMLEPDDDIPVPSPRVFLSQAKLPGEQDFDPYDPINLESEHRRVASPFVSVQPKPSRSQPSQYSQNTSSTGTSSNKLDVIQPAEHSRNNSDPPTYSEHIGDEGVGHQLLNETPSKDQQQSQSFSQNSQTSQNPLASRNSATMASSGLQQPNKPDNGPPPRNVPSDIPRALAVTRDQRVEVAHGTQHISPAQTSTPFLHPSRDGPPPASVNHGNESDIQSTHYSTSTFSSSQFQNERKPPPRRHLPKRLVMPAPLNTGPPLNSMPSLHIHQNQIYSHVNVKQTHFQPPPLNQHSLSRSPLGNVPVTPIHHYENTRAEDVSVSGGRKLRKRVSMLNTSTPAPVISTVSFAPPMIGFHNNAATEKVMARSETERIPKRFLSKRKT